MKKVVIEGSTVTVGQCKDLFRMIGDGTIGYPEMQRFLPSPTETSIWVSAEQLDVLFKSIREHTIDFAKMKNFLEHPRGNAVITYPNYVRATKILGHENVLTVQRAYRLWDIPYSLEERYMLDPIKYSEATLRKCAVENKQGKSSWYLIYTIGYSLVEQRRKLGINTSFQPCFHRSYDWFLDEKEDYWTKKRSESGYYLINFHDCGTHSLQYEEQKQVVESLGSEYGVLEPQMFSESLISINKKNKSGIARFWEHRPLLKTSTGQTISLGDFSEEGLKVEQCSPEWGYGSLRMVVYRKHDVG